MTVRRRADENNRPQAKAFFDEPLDTGRIESQGRPAVSPYPRHRMLAAYIRWKACTPFSCFTLYRPRW
jgi:hypothetical protein